MYFLIHKYSVVFNSICSPFTRYFVFCHWRARFFDIVAGAYSLKLLDTITNESTFCGLLGVCFFFPSTQFAMSYYNQGPPFGPPPTFGAPPPPGFGVPPASYMRRQQVCTSTHHHANA